MAITDYTVARIAQSVATLYGATTRAGQLVRPENLTSVSRVKRGGTVVRDYVPLAASGSTTALAANTPVTASGSQNIVPVTYILREYGAGSDAVTFPWQDFLVRAEAPGAYEAIVQSVAHKAITAVEELAITQLRDAIGGGTDASYVHPLGPDNVSGSAGFTSPVASKLVRYGTQTASRASRNLITSSDTLTWAWIRAAVASLTARRVRPLLTTDAGAPVYALLTHPHVLMDLLGSLTLDSYPSVQQWISQGNLAANGILSVYGYYEGVLLIASDRMIYSGAGASGIDVYAATLLGGDFLGKAALAPEAMPQRPTDGDLYPVGDGACVIVQPSYGAIHSNRTGTCAWYGYLGYGVLDPLAAIRFEVASASAAKI